MEDVKVILLLVSGSLSDSGTVVVKNGSFDFCERDTLVTYLVTLLASRCSLLSHFQINSDCLEPLVE